MNTLTFVILCLEGAVLSFNVAAVAAVVPSIAREFSLSQFIVGKIIWLYMLPYGVAALAYGPLVRVLDARKVELGCLLLFSLANLMAGVAGHIRILFAARFLMGVFGASVVPLALVLISRHAVPIRRGRLVGIFFSATFVASLLGLFLSGVMPWRLLFIIPAIAGLLVGAAMYRYLPSFKTDGGPLRIQYHRAFMDARITRIFLYIFSVSFLYHGVQQWLGVYFSRQFAWSQFAISMLITLTSFSGIIGEAAGGLMADSWGRMRTVMTGIVLMTAGVFALLCTNLFVVVALLMLVWGLGWTINHAGVSTLLTDLPQEFLHEAASLNSSVRFLSGGIGVACAGLLMQQGMRVHFIIFGVGLGILALFGNRLLTQEAGHG